MLKLRTSNHIEVKRVKLIHKGLYTFVSYLNCYKFLDELFCFSLRCVQRCMPVLLYCCVLLVSVNVAVDVQYTSHARILQYLLVWHFVIPVACRRHFVVVACV